MSRFSGFGRAAVVVLLAGCGAAPGPPAAAPAGSSVAPVSAPTSPALVATIPPAPEATATPPAAESTPAPAALATTVVAAASAAAVVATTTSAGAQAAVALPDGTAPIAGQSGDALPDGTIPTAGQSGDALPDGTIPTAGQPAIDANCDGTSRPDPLPAPGSARAQDFFRSFRTPLAPAPLYDPPGQRRVGLQAGHWLNEDVPPELGRLQGGAFGGGKQEWQVNLDIAQRTAALLEGAGVQVDVLPATVPPRYQANAFIALHADGDPAGQARGFKVARPGFSSLPVVDDQLVDTLNQVYGADTALPRDDEHISLRMRYYYAFNSRRYCHAVAPGVPQAIIEMGYLTSAVDRDYLIGNPDTLAHALADSVMTFLNTLP